MEKAAAEERMRVGSDGIKVVLERRRRRAMTAAELNGVKEEIKFHLRQLLT